MSATWDQIHVGDAVRGADQRAWTVVVREPGPRWTRDGQHDWFVLRLDAREVRVSRRLIDPAQLATRADHSAEAGAWQALSDNGFQLKLIGESLMTDPFESAGRPEVKLDRWNRYILPHPETGKEQAWTRVTTLARTLSDEYGLTQWMKRNVARGMALRPDLIAGAAAADPDEDKSTLESVVKQAEEAAGAKKGANLGTAFHAAAYRADRGEKVQLPAPLDTDVAEYQRAMRDRGLRVIPEYAERIVLIPELECAGTLDRIVSQPSGATKSEPLSILDLKSGKDLSYAWLEIAIQQACYSRATHMWDKAKRAWEPMPKVDQHRALIAHSPIGAGRTDIYGVNLIEGWDYARLAMKVREARKSVRGWLVDPDDHATVALHLARNATSQTELADLWSKYHPRGLWTDEVMAAAQARLTELQPA